MTGCINVIDLGDAGRWNGAELVLEARQFRSSPRDCRFQDVVLARHLLKQRFEPREGLFGIGFGGDNKLASQALRLVDLAAISGEPGQSDETIAADVHHRLHGEAREFAQRDERALAVRRDGE